MAIFDILARRNVEQEKERSPPAVMSLDNEGEEKIQNIIAPRSHNPVLANELGKRLLYMLRLAENSFPSNSQRHISLELDNKTKYRWNGMEKLDLSPETELTEHDFWLAYITKTAAAITWSWNISPPLTIRLI